LVSKYMVYVREEKGDFQEEEEKKEEEKVWSTKKDKAGINGYIVQGNEELEAIIVQLKTIRNHLIS